MYGIRAAADVGVEELSVKDKLQDREREREMVERNTCQSVRTWRNDV